jgi:hypothetical protein
MALRLSFGKHIVEELIYDGGEILEASYSGFKMVGLSRCPFKYLPDLFHHFLLPSTPPYSS